MYYNMCKIHINMSKDLHATRDYSVLAILVTFVIALWLYHNVITYTRKG